MTNHGILRILDNAIDVRVAQEDCLCAKTQNVPSALGFELRAMDGVELRAIGNTIRFLDRSDPVVAFPGDRETELTGIRVDRARHGNLTFAGNVVEEATYGLFARDLDKTVAWKLLSNQFRAATAWRGDKVENRPEETA
jgi:hypothetical protein